MSFLDFIQKHRKCAICEQKDLRENLSYLPRYGIYGLTSRKDYYHENCLDIINNPKEHSHRAVDMALYLAEKKISEQRKIEEKNRITAERIKNLQKTEIAQETFELPKIEIKDKPTFNRYTALIDGKM